jgi:hypothetical protein
LVVVAQVPVTKRRRRRRRRHANAVMKELKGSLTGSGD